MLTIANQCEMFSFGIVANKGTDFFTLFEKDNKDVISKQDVAARWHKIDRKNKGFITRKDVSNYLIKHQDV